MTWGVGTPQVVLRCTLENVENVSMRAIVLSACLNRVINVSQQKDMTVDYSDYTNQTRNESLKIPERSCTPTQAQKQSLEG